MRNLLSRSKFLAPALCVLFSVLLMEIGLRVAYSLFGSVIVYQLARKNLSSGPASPYEKPGQSYTTYAVVPEIHHHSFLGYSPVPNIAGNGYRTNNSGFRYDENLPEIKSAGEIRIFVTGGSTAWGTGVNQEQLYSSVAQGLFHKFHPGKAIRVISAGVGGYCSTQERILTENLLVRFRPDYVVMFSGWNDGYFGYSGVNILNEQDFFDYKYRLGEAEQPPTLKSLQPLGFNKYFFKLHWALDRAIFRIKYRDQASLAEKIRSMNLSRNAVSDRLFHNIRILQDIQPRFGFRLIFFLQPTLYNTSKNLSGYEKEVLALRESEYVGFAGYNREFYDLIRPALQAEAAGGKMLFSDADEAIRNEPLTVFTDDVHLGDRGNRLIGEQLYGLLEAAIRRDGKL